MSLYKADLRKKSLRSDGSGKPLWYSRKKEGDGSALDQAMEVLDWNHLKELNGGR